MKKIFYHGSPYKLNIIEQQTPTYDGPIDFDKQTGVFITDYMHYAKLYAIVRDKQRINKQFSILPYPSPDSPLCLLLEYESWIEEDNGYELNDYGYLHYIKLNISNPLLEQHPYEKRNYEYIIKQNIKPYKIKKVKRNLKII